MQSTYMRPRPHAHMYQEVLRDAQLVESLGFDSFWMGEHHFVYDGYCPSLLVAASGILAVTSRIQVGSAIMLLPLHDPERIAEAAAAIASFAPGRLRLGVAGGWREVEYNALGLELSDRPRIVDEYLTALVDGDYADRLGNVELAMGGGANAALRRAGRFGLPPLMAMAGPDEVRERNAIWKHALRPGLDREPRITTIRDVWVGRDEVELEWVKRRMEEAWRFYSRFDGATVKEIHLPGEKASEDIDENVAAMMAFATVGSPEQVREELAEIVAAGIDELILRVRFDGLEPRYVDACLRLLADEVVPYLKESS
jgi:alkanesulfonate monooxygenase SsuD/methylene tetrahydromethanopterin reductase-like flavin-dependent oxidoreductase (luciferase family)